jgi:hypothetical protein
MSATRQRRQLQGSAVGATKHPGVAVVSVEPPSEDPIYWRTLDLVCNDREERCAANRVSVVC